MKNETGQEEVQHWFGLYLAQQVIKADLVKQQWLDRPEVAALTEGMARSMLTQPNGPLYRELANGSLADRVAYRQERRKRILAEGRFAAALETIRRRNLRSSRSNRFRGNFGGSS